MAQKCLLRNICQTSGCLSMRIVFSPVICKSTISLSATCPVPHSQDDGDRISDDSKTCNENKNTAVDPKKIPEHKVNPAISHSKGPSFLDNQIKMRPLSPIKRLASILPQEYTNLIDGSENDMSHINDNKSGSYCDAELSKNGFDFKDSQARSKSVLPSRRLSNMIPSIYWEEVDKDTKSIVQNIGGDVFDTEGKNKKNV
ncbi:hypothetical protein ACJMK2_036103 [Sinanodonta woodiana]|uniref:Uncharacterized protein n=1 Tax=Sinanodonta woodiana TaxID=1069815 RepID=A0ABD3WG66_SINWO